jgi:hypothetical protein
MVRVLLALDVEFSGYPRRMELLNDDEESVESVSRRPARCAHQRRSG